MWAILKFILIVSQSVLLSLLCLHWFPSLSHQVVTFGQVALTRLFFLTLAFIVALYQITSKR